MRAESALLLVIVGASVLGCGQARRSEPLMGPLVLASDGEQGRTAYMKYCHQCHPGGEAGLGPSLNDKALPTFLKRFQVRQGIGSMPSFSEEQISDEELDDIMEYLKALRNHDGGPGR
ncbi:MAG TPA: cytochrome c [Gemmatimonadota bacterium]|nr:cytochrome c [Gemmatimonadota bacterium]